MAPLPTQQAHDKPNQVFSFMMEVADLCIRSRGNQAIQAKAQSLISAEPSIGWWLRRPDTLQVQALGPLTAKDC